MTALTNGQTFAFMLAVLMVTAVIIVTIINVIGDRHKRDHIENMKAYELREKGIDPYGPRPVEVVGPEFYETRSHRPVRVDGLGEIDTRPRPRPIKDNPQG